MDELPQIAAEIARCTRCILHQGRTRAVPGEGSPRAEIMFIGEGPGYYEDQEGRPFVGPAGRLLEECLRSIGLQRSDVFITNVVKCRPPGNRDPLPDEIAACNDFLDRQIAALQPKLIVTLGRFSMAKFFPPGKSISQLHGTTVRYGNALCYALYHPAAALRQERLKAVLEEDFRRIPEVLERARRLATREGAEARPREEPEQLSLF